MRVIASGLAILLSISNSAFAEDINYRIELIVFAQNLPSSETFNQSESQIQWPTTELLSELSSFKPAQSTLTHTVNALAQNPLYQPLLHVTWLQPQNQGQLSPVHIKSNDGQINGFVQLKNASSLELLADFEYTISSPANDSKPEIYRLSETRPTKLNEIYYLDHPKFGVIAKITVP